MKTKLSIILTVLLMLSCVPAQSNAGTLSSNLSNAISKVHDKIDSAFSKVKSKFTKSKTEEENKATEAKSSETETEKKSVFKKALDKARNVLKESFNMNFLSSVPVIFWKKTFNKMFDYAQTTIDDMNLEHNGEIITRDDFQDDKALHIKKSAELALHIKSLFGSSVFAYGVTLAVGGIKELIDSSFLNPNGGRCWEDFYADMVGASAVFGEEAFDKKLNKYMDSFLKEKRTVNKVEDEEIVPAVAYSNEPTEVIEEENKEELIETEENIDTTNKIDNTSNFADIAQEKQRLTAEYYEAVKRGDTEAVKEISEQLRNLK